MKKTKELLRKITMESLVSAAEEMGISEEELETDALEIENNRSGDGLTDLIVEIIDIAAEKPGFSKCYEIENNDYTGFVIYFSEYPEKDLIIEIGYPQNVQSLINEIIEKIEKYKTDDVVFDNIYLYYQGVVSLEEIMGRTVTEEEVKTITEKFYHGGLIKDAIRDFLTKMIETNL